YTPTVESARLELELELEPEPAVRAEFPSDEAGAALTGNSARTGAMQRYSASAPLSPASSAAQRRVRGSYADRTRERARRSGRRSAGTESSTVLRWPGPPLRVCMLPRMRRMAVA